MRLIDVDLKIRGKPEESQKGNGIFLPSLPSTGIVIPQFPRNTLSSFATTLRSPSIFCIRFETTSISRADRSCSRRTEPRSKKLFSITIMSGARVKHKGGESRGGGGGRRREERAERKLETKESVSDSDRSRTDNREIKDQ